MGKSGSHSFRDVEVHVGSMVTRSRSDKNGHGPPYQTRSRMITQPDSCVELLSDWQSSDSQLSATTNNNTGQQRRSDTPSKQDKAATYIQHFTPCRQPIIEPQPQPPLSPPRTSRPVHQTPPLSPPNKPWPTARRRDILPPPPNPLTVSRFLMATTRTTHPPQAPSVPVRSRPIRNLRSPPHPRTAPTAPTPTSQHPQRSSSPNGNPTPRPNPAQFATHSSRGSTGVTTAGASSPRARTTPLTSPRKCGRVVCASCSPHRITIPAAFVVRPPDAPSPVPIIDLTSSPESGNAVRRERTWNTHPLEDAEDEEEEQETYSDEDEDEDDDDEAAQVRICEDCLGRRAPGGRSVSNPGVIYGGPSSSSVAVPSDRRRRQSVRADPRCLHVRWLTVG